MRRIWYFPIEPLKSRYTYQMCNLWEPKAFEKVISKRKDVEVVRVDGLPVAEDIQVGSVLDATGRGIYALTQVADFLKRMSARHVKSGDTLYFSDFWTPGMEAIFYAAELMHLNLYYYSMCHADTFDIYDFTYPMRDWMRPIEMAYANKHTGIFVASSLHKELLLTCGVTAPIHVVSLPIDFGEVNSRIRQNKKNIVTFISRLDWEKQPEFMLEVACKFLEKHPDWVWAISTSRKEFKSTLPGLIEKMYRLAKRYKNLFLLPDQSKDKYYDLLGQSKINFNCSLQDFVSWTLLEACIANCDLVYPNFRSFTECVPHDRLYKAFDVDDALRLFDEVIAQPRTHYHIPMLSNIGRLRKAKIIVDGTDKEYNIYKEDLDEHDFS